MKYIQQHRTMRLAGMAMCTLLINIACADDSTQVDDAGTTDQDMQNVGTTDAGSPDLSGADAATSDDAGLEDTGGLDSGTPDAGGPDAGTPDGGDGPNLCEGIDCGGGSCAVLAGVPECICPDRFEGPRCEDCSRGYTGIDCEQCADGFTRDPLGDLCIVDPCAGDRCNGAGTCFGEFEADGTPSFTCRCDVGFTGDTCDTCDMGYEGANCDACATGYTMENGECVILACSPIPCDRGLCVDVDSDGEAECECERGWTGRDCGTCANGFILDATGECVLDVCFDVTCDSGTCEPDANSSTGVCVCDEGYTGDTCDTCDTGYNLVTVGNQQVCANVPPVRDSRMRGWFDAAAAETFVFDGGDGVDKWYSRIGTAVWWDGGPANYRPRYIVLPQPAVEFDGNDALWSGSFLVGSVEAYSIFAVVTWNNNTTEDILAEARYVDGNETTYRVTVGGSNALFEHGGPTRDAVQLSTYSAAAGPQLVVVQRQPFLNGRAMLISDGLSEQTTTSVQPDISNQALSYLGSSSSLAWGVDGLDGRVHEIIYVDGALSSEERQAMTEYLMVKWGL